MLEEFTYDISGGKARKKTYYPIFEDNIKFLVRVFHKAIQLESEIDFNSFGWKQLVEAQRVRNRVTHPKTDECLKVSDEDINTVRVGLTWYEQTIERMLERLEKDSIYAARCK